MPRRSELTVYQLKAFVKAVELVNTPRSGTDPPPTMRDLARVMRVSRQQVEGALERLEALVGESLVTELDDGLQVRRTDLFRSASKVLDELAEFEREARSRAGKWWLRMDGYWAHLGLFLADAIREVELSHPELYVELSPRFGQSRAFRGAELARRVERGELDLAVAPSGSRVAEGVAKVATHSVLLFAAFGPDHQLRADSPGATVDIQELVDNQYPLLVSPRGHTTRELLEQHVRTGEQLNIEVEGTEPAALVALQSRSRVAIVASDSILPPHLLPGDWTEHSGSDAHDLWSVPPHWRAVTHDQALLREEYSIFHRLHIPKDERHHFPSVRFVPPNVADWLSELAARAASLASERLGKRTEAWDRKGT